MAAARISNGEPNGMIVAELLLATVMIGILYAVAIPGILGGIHRTGVEGASRRLTEDIRLAQSKHHHPRRPDAPHCLRSGWRRAEPGRPQRFDEGEQYRIELGRFP